MAAVTETPDPAGSMSGHGPRRAAFLGGTVTVRDGSPGVMVQARLPAVTAPVQLPSLPEG